MSTAVDTVRVHPYKYMKDYDAVVAFLTQYINKRVPTPSVMVASVYQNRPAKQQKTTATHGTLKERLSSRCILGRNVTQC